MDRQFSENLQPAASDRGSAESGYARLVSWFTPLESAIVAFSGGVDSTLVLAAAHDALGSKRVTALTADSPSLARRDFDQCVELAEALGVTHEVIQTTETATEGYQANLGNRCYFCKSALYQGISELLQARTAGIGAIGAGTCVVDGTNVDDLQDVRPGRKAAEEAGVRHPLVELGITKAEVRELSRYRNLPTWDKAEMACLSSRIPAGIRVTEEKLKMIESAERALYDLGLRGFRVRYHELGSLRDLGSSTSSAQPLTLARIELQAGDFSSLLSDELRNAADAALRKCGFSFSTIDLSGYRKGGTPQKP